MKTVSAIIQARMTSSRLPGKILKKVLGKPLLSYQLERLQGSRLLGGIYMATTTNAQDDAVAAWANQEQVPCYRGAEDDVLDRYVQAARLFGVDHVMRITADCPLIQPDICDQFIEKYIKEDLEALEMGSSFAEGLDLGIYGLQALEVAWREATLRSDREHVATYIRHRPQRFKYGKLENETDDSRYRITVDETEDFQVVKAIIEHLYRAGTAPFGIDEIKRFLDSHPEIYRINYHIIRNEGYLKSLAQDALDSNNRKQP